MIKEDFIKMHPNMYEISNGFMGWHNETDYNTPTKYHSMKA